MTDKEIIASRDKQIIGLFKIIQNQTKLIELMENGVKEVKQSTGRKARISTKLYNGGYRVIEMAFRNQEHEDKWLDDLDKELTKVIGFRYIDDKHGY